MRIYNIPGRKRPFHPTPLHSTPHPLHSSTTSSVMNEEIDNIISQINRVSYLKDVRTRRLEKASCLRQEFLRTKRLEKAACLRQEFLRKKRLERAYRCKRDYLDTERTKRLEKASLLRNIFLNSSRHQRILRAVLLQKEYLVKLNIKTQAELDKRKEEEQRQEIVEMDNRKKEEEIRLRKRTLDRRVKAHFILFGFAK